MVAGSLEGEERGRRRGEVGGEVESEGHGWKFCFFGSEPKIHSFFGSQMPKSQILWHHDKSA